MDSTPTASKNAERLVSIVLLGLAGCAVTIVITSQPERVSTVRSVGALFGLYLAFVAISGVLYTLRE